MTELRIPGLDTHWELPNGRVIDLSLVPPMPRHEGDGHLKLCQEQFLEWAEQVLRFRLQRWEMTTHRIAGINIKDQQEIELEMCRRHGVKYFTTIWGSIFEAREDEQGLIEGGDWKPFILYPFQVWFLDWMEARKASRGPLRNGWISKSRDMGITNCGCMDTLNDFLFKKPAVTKMISRRADLVDDIGNLDSMFERISSHLNPAMDICLPDFMLPRGFIYEEHRQLNKIRRPDNSNMVNGESSSSRSGRGGRAGKAWVDEGAFIRGLKTLLSSLFMTSPHVFICSSESVEVDDYFGEAVDRLRQELPDALIEMEYWIHPFHDSEWLEQTRQVYELNDNIDGFYREVMRQRNAGLTDWIYPTAREIRALPEAIDYSSEFTLISGIDPGKADDTALGWAMIDRDPLGRDTFLEGYINRGQLPEYYAAILLGCDPDDEAMLEEFPSFRFTERERQLMEWTRSLPQPIVYGDPHGAGGSRIADRSDDWYNRMLLFSRKYNPRKDEFGKGKALVVVKNFSDDARPHQARHNALNEWLQRLDFNPTPGARRFLSALQQSKFEISGFARTSEQVEPKHDDLSHPRTAMEYMAVNIDPVRRRAKGVRGNRQVVPRADPTVVRIDKQRGEEVIDPFEKVDTARLVPMHGGR